MLTDKRWQKLLQVMKSSGRIYNKPEHRMTFEGILYRLRTGIPWRDLPTEFGGWSAIETTHHSCLFATTHSFAVNALLHYLSAVRHYV